MRTSKPTEAPPPPPPVASEDLTMLAGPGIEAVAVGDAEEGTVMFLGDETSTVVADKREENPESEVEKVMEIRTKIKFTGNKETLKNPELVEKILEDITEQQKTMPGLNFIFCAHVGTTVGDRILTARPGFMEGRVKSFKDALQPDGTMPGVSGVIDGEFMHFKTTRFAGLVMWAYNGEKAPACAQDDLVPPPPTR